MTNHIEASGSDALASEIHGTAMKDAEAERQLRVVARMVYCAGSLVEYHHPLSAGFVKPIAGSQPSKSLPLLSIFELPRAVAGMTDAEVKYLESVGLMSVFEWQREAEFAGRIELALWLPDLGHNREVKAPAPKKTGRAMPAPRQAPKPTEPQFTAYPPQPVSWHNMMNRDPAVPKLFEDDVGTMQVVAIIDCENQKDLKSLYERFGDPV